ncbi:hypothetical protein Tco_0978499 [Tanacetum coccineum]|uniref:Uncharacterized protein n=1 Tax=Tanacetum coccineum TaxID=301880 RepID=A0ABQ5ENK3_9ASTR
MKLDQFTQFRFHSLTEEEGWIRIKEYVQYQDDLWDEPSPFMNISSISEAMQPTLKGRLKRACKGPHEADECEQNNPSEQVCLSGGDIYNDPSLLRFYQNDDTAPWGNNKRKEKEEDGPNGLLELSLKMSLPPLPALLSEEISHKRDRRRACPTS